MDNMTKSEGSDEVVIQESVRLRKPAKVKELKLEITVPYSLPYPAILFSPRPLSELDAAAVIMDSDNMTKSEGSDEVVIQESVHFRKPAEAKELKLETTVPYPLPYPAIMLSPRPLSQHDAAAVKLQKVYRIYRARRNLADCAAVIVEEMWWKALDFARLKQISVSFFDPEKPETTVSRWARAGTKAAKIGKGLSEDGKARKLAITYWLEAIDPHHRYGNNLNLYYDIWFSSGTSQPFFYWLDVGDAKEINLEKCPRTVLQKQCIKYLSPKEREAYEVIIDDGKLVYRQNGVLVNTVEGSEWIFVLSPSRNMYVAEKKEGQFHHSSFLAGGAILAVGRLVAHNGVLQDIWPYSGYYHPTEENLIRLISFLQGHHADLTNVKVNHK